jgi:pyruvate/2-oxoglutarate/acetoin dehydrogenase E1 component
VIFFEHKGLYGRKGPVERGDGGLLPHGKAGVLRAGGDVTVVSTLLLADRAAAAAERLDEEGIGVEVIDLRWLRPMDMETVAASVAKTGRLVVVEEQTHAGGWGATVISRLVMGGSELRQPPLALSLPENMLIPYTPALEDSVIPSVEAIAERIRSYLGG